MASTDSFFRKKSTHAVNSNGHTENAPSPETAGGCTTIRGALNVCLRNQFDVQSHGHTLSATPSIRSVEEALAKIDQAAGVKDFSYSGSGTGSGL